MNKLLGYFVKKKDASTSDVDFPQLEKEEEEEIQQHLGIPTGTLNTRALLMATLKNFSQYDEEENDGYMAAGTVRIKDKKGDEVIGTVRLKRGEEFGTVSTGVYQTYSIEEVIDTEDEVPAWADFGTIRIAADDIASGETRIVSPRSSGGVGYIYRPPEDWELNILSLENGEWGENMSEDAFGKFRKRRAGVQNLFTSSAGQDKSSTTAGPSSSKHHSHTHEHHKGHGTPLGSSDGHHKPKESKKEKHHKAPHSGSKSPQSERADRRDKTDRHSEKLERDFEDKIITTPSDPTLRSWAKYRQLKDDDNKK